MIAPDILPASVSTSHTYELTFQYTSDKRVYSTQLTIKETAMVFNSGMLDGKTLKWAQIWDGSGTDELRYDFEIAKQGLPAFKAIVGEMK